MILPLFSKQTNINSTQIHILCSLSKQTPKYFFPHFKTQSPLFFSLIPTIQHKYLFKNPHTSIICLQCNNLNNHLHYRIKIITQHLNFLLSLVITRFATYKKLSCKISVRMAIGKSNTIRFAKRARLCKKNNGHHLLICRARLDLEPRLGLIIMGLMNLGSRLKIWVLMMIGSQMVALLGFKRRERERGREMN